jgi:hypothetical protein
MGGPKRFLVGRDPMEHFYSANAVALAYSVIEELGFEVRVKQNEASKMPDGRLTIAAPVPGPTPVTIAIGFSVI